MSSDPEANGSVLWESWHSNRFKKRYKKLELQLRERVAEALEQLETANYPERLGVPKVGGLKGTLAYELGQDCRILYVVARKENTIQFHRVCSHKEVYGKD